MKIEQLVKMLGQIEGFFRSEPDEAEAIRNIADHMNRFWDPRMRARLFAYGQQYPERFNTRAAAAVARLNPASPRFQMPVEAAETAELS